MCSLPLGLLGKDKKKLLLKKPTHSFLFLVLRASVPCKEVVCGEQEEEQVSGFTRCVHGWISLPFMYLCFMKPLPWWFKDRVPPGLPLLLAALCWQGSHLQLPSL